MRWRQSMPSCCKIVMLAAVWLLRSDCFGAGAIINYPEATVAGGSISESRGKPGACVVELVITGNAVADSMGFLETRVTSAFDDVGNDLRQPEANQNAGWSVSGDASLAPLRGTFDFGARGKRSSAVAVRLPARAAKTIKELRGTVELYCPTLQNGGVVILHDFCTQPGIIQTNVDLEKHQVQLTWQTRESYAAAEKMREAATTDPRRVQPRSAANASYLFPGNYGDTPNSRGNVVVLEAVDPEQKLVGFAFRKAGAHFLPVRGRSSAGRFYRFDFDGVLPETIDLYVYLAAPAAVKRIPFDLENLPLP